MQSERKRSKDLFKQFIKLFKKIDVEGIAEKIGIDEFSKKLNLREHLLIMLWYVIGDYITRVELSDSLKGILPKRYRLIEISKSQSLKVNKSKDYRAFVWAFYEMIFLTEMRISSLPYNFLFICSGQDWRWCFSEDPSFWKSTDPS